MSASAIPYLDCPCCGQDVIPAQLCCTYHECSILRCPTPGPECEATYWFWDGDTKTCPECGCTVAVSASGDYDDPAYAVNPCDYDPPGSCACCDAVRAAS